MSGLTAFFLVAAFQVAPATVEITPERAEIEVTQTTQHLDEKGDSEYLQKELDAADKAELVTCIDDYRQGLVPLVVPLTLLQHHFRRHPAPWVADQTYLNPYPAELMLRNHV